MKVNLIRMNKIYKFQKRKIKKNRLLLKMKLINLHKVKIREEFHKVSNQAKHVNDKIHLINLALVSLINNKIPIF